jgi:hypothetical protein
LLVRLLPRFGYVATGISCNTLLCCNR